MKKKTEQHISIPFKTLKNPEYRNLSGSSKAILEQMLMYYYPNQPDRFISMSYREVRNILGFSYGHISKSFKELLNKKFIFLEYKGGLNTPSKYSLNSTFFKLKTY
jgi:hypothetical protein